MARRGKGGGVWDVAWAVWPRGSARPRLLVVFAVTWALPWASSSSTGEQRGEEREAMGEEEDGPLVPKVGLRVTLVKVGLLSAGARGSGRFVLLRLRSSLYRTHN
ncbi:uncharacterized protein [Aegilops tauschii subsp. strangulata]|uniref:uncharacterized protein n=1 Tax=Aegilops tauschii subsp. strangulata TaxID=200361 RepID=UPI001E1CA469|nr:uncharacterized protein LOC109735385 isoform X2 [Aegilops tauschii subsp. strangulata]